MADTVKVTIQVKMSQMNRLNLLRAALAEKMGKEMTLNQLVEKIIDDFLDTK